MNIDSQKHDDFVRQLVDAQRSIYAYLFTLVRHHDDAEDLLQQVSVILWHKFDTFEPGTDFRAWACRVAHLEAMNFLRSRKQGDVELSEAMLERLAAEKVARAGEHDTYRDALQTCLGRMADVQRKLVQRCYSGAESVKEVADDLGRPVGSVYVSLTRIRQSLLKCVQEQVRKEADQ